MANFTHGSRTLLLVANFHGLEDFVGAQLLNTLLQGRISFRDFKFTLGLTHQVTQFDLKIDQRLQGFVPEEDRLKHFILGQQLCFAFDHDDRLAGAGNGDIEIAVLHLLKSRISDQFSVHPADTHSGNRSVERDVGHFNCSRCCHNSESVGIIDQVG